MAKLTDEQGSKIADMVSELTDMFVEDLEFTSLEQAQVGKEQLLKEFESMVEDLAECAWDMSDMYAED